MKHVTDNQRVIGRKDYWQTDDSNIVIELQTVSREIHLDKLQEKIAQLEAELAASQPLELPEELLTQLNQTMTDSLNDNGETFQKITDIVYAVNTQDASSIQAELDKLKTLLSKVTEDANNL